MADFKQKILYLQEKLKRDPSPNKMMQYIERLDRVPMTLELLQETGIGKTVNTLRKHEDVGSTARDLVQKWKQLVDLEKKNSEIKKSDNNKNDQLKLNKSDKSDKSDKHKSHKSHTDKVDKIDNKLSDNLKSENKNRSKNNYEKLEKCTGKYKSPERWNSQLDDNESDSDRNSSRTSSQQCTLTVETVYNERYDESGQRLGEPYERVKKEIGKDKPSKDHHVESSKLKHKESKDHKHKQKSETENNKIKPASTSVKVEAAFTNNVMSFEDCLTLADSKKKLKKNKSPEKKSSEKSHSSSSSVNHSHKSHKSHDKKSSHKSDKSHKSKEDKLDKSIKEANKFYSNENEKRKSDEVTCELLTKKPKYTEIDILSTLPEIQPDYKPLPHRDIDYYSNKKKNVVMEDPTKFTTSRSSRTQVFSGRKVTHLTEVSSLYDMCIKILIENIDAIECVGIVPFDILKPVLERCTSQQLYNLEDFNPHLIEDTDELWHCHCRREFRGCEPDEFESWRELYLRKLDEREARFKSIKANITASLSKANPVRTIKLAYVDDVVKPPRDVRRKQAKHGTGSFGNQATKPKSSTNQNESSSSSKAVASSPTPSSPVKKTLDSPPQVNTNIGTSLSNFGGSSTEKTSNRTPKTVKVVAPMMQKVRKMMKTHYRR